MSSEEALPTADDGRWMHDLISELFPICRSITGDGVRRTLQILRDHIPIEVNEVPTGEQVFDWTIPREWNIADAWIKDSGGRKVVDFNESNLHVLNYSCPIEARMSLSELREHLYTIPEAPDRIPYRTSYFLESWGFCLTHNQLESLNDQEEYHVCIDSSLSDGSLTYGELLLAGEMADEVLVSTHVCHPSMANDNLSGIAVAVRLAQLLAGRTLRYSYRFLFTPATIGSIAWLSRNRNTTHRIRNGLVLACLGDPGPFCYQESRAGDSEIDHVLTHAMNERSEAFETRSFSPVGGDERQFCSPGFNLPVGRLTRTPFWELPENHTSADDLGLVKPEALAQSLSVLLAAVDLLEANRRFVNLSPYGEPQLGRRDLYTQLGGQWGEGAQAALLWVLNLSDGQHSLLEICNRSGLPFDRIQEAAAALEQAGLLQPETDSGNRD